MCRTENPRRYPRATASPTSRTAIAGSLSTIIPRLCPRQRDSRSRNRIEWIRADQPKRGLQVARQGHTTASGPTETSVRARTESGYWFQVHHEPELGRLHDRQVARFLAFEDAADINANLT